MLALRGCKRLVPSKIIWRALSTSPPPTQSKLQPKSQPPQTKSQNENKKENSNSNPNSNSNSNLNLNTNSNVNSSLVADVKMLSRKFHIHSLDDWYTVPKAHIRLFGGSWQLCKTYETVEAMVRAMYPTHQWDHSKFVQHQPKTLSAETFMRRVVLSLFPSSPSNPVIVNARSEHNIRGENNLPLELDLYLPALRLAFEYQDPHHYFHNRTYGSSTLREYQHRDKIKNEKAKELGITIINIPFWWDWNADSLVSTVKHVRPDLLKNHPDTGAPIITEEAPQHIIDLWTHDVPGIGVPMLALEAPRKQSFDPTNWFMFEKFDGVRALWNPYTRQFYSRWGRDLIIPNFISDTLPQNDWLDGEVSTQIWFGRERGMRYEAIKAALHLVAWERAKYVVFDCINPDIRDSMFIDRYERLQSIMPASHPFVQLAQYDVCTGKQHAETLFFSVRALSGEGIILRDPQAGYDSGYSRALYKYKGFNDAEALVLKKLSDKTFLCRINKLHLRHNMSTDSEDIETSEEKDTEEYYDVEMTIDEELFDYSVEEIEEGIFISFKYAGEYSKGLGRPMNPKIYTIRADITSWDQILSSKRKAPAQPATKQIWKPEGKLKNWTDKSNRRKFFDQIAKDNNFDPLIAENWYSLDSKEILKEGRGLLVKYYNSSHFQALMDIYPEVEWKETNFNRVPKHFWENKENKKQFFDSIAKERGFDALNPENWYNVSRVDVSNYRGGKGLLKHFNNSLVGALEDVYPFLNFDKSKFKSVTKNFWNAIENQREFFIEFAKKQKFDPLQANNWYSVSSAQIKAEKGGKIIMGYYGDSLGATLEQVFKDIVKFDKYKFAKKPPVK